MEMKYKDHNSTKKKSQRKGMARNAKIHNNEIVEKVNFNVMQR